MHQGGVSAVEGNKRSWLMDAAMLAANEQGRTTCLLSAIICKIFFGYSCCWILGVRKMMRYLMTAMKVM